MAIRSRTTRPARRPATSFPVAIRAHDIAVGPVEREHVRRRLGFKLDKHSARIERVSVRLEDVNGPRGGIDKMCRIKVVLRRLPTVVIEQQDGDLLAACDQAADRAERAVRRTVGRRRG